VFELLHQKAEHAKCTQSVDVDASAAAVTQSNNYLTLL